MINNQEISAGPNVQSQKSQRGAEVITEGKALDV